MNIAYLVLAHKNPEQLNELIEQLATRNADIFIHIDQKNSWIKKQISKNLHVHILSDSQSCSVSWGDNNMVLAILNLIEAVQKTNRQYDYLWLLSGQDFPLLSQREIEARLAQNKDQNYIQIIDETSKLYTHFQKRCEIWYPKWIVKDSIIIKIIKKIYLLATGGTGHTFKIFKRKKPFTHKFYFGSSWWCLTPKVAFEMLDYCQKNPAFIKYFNRAINSDECIFQTLFMNSEYTSTQAEPLTFVNWGGGRRSPNILTSDDAERLKQASKKFCFARKFDFNVWRIGQ